MYGLFTGLELGKRALLSQQSAMTTVGHNIANASTPGYSRQRVELTSTDPYVDTTGRFGTGVTIGTVRQIRDLYLTSNYREESRHLGEWSARERTLTQIETLFGEPTDRGLNQWMEDYFNAWHELSLRPDDLTSRNALLEKAQILVNGIHQLDNRLSQIQRSMEDEIDRGVSDLNEMAGQVADLNRRISRQELDGHTANDLRDQRDRLIDQMSTKAQVSVIEEKTGVQRVFIGMMEYVESTTYTPLATELSPATTGNDQFRVIWQGSLTTVQPQGGELAALMQLRDATIPSYRAQLDQMARSLVEEVNAVHRAAYGLDGLSNRDFFDPSGLTASSININASLLNDPSLLAVSASGAPGDGTAALNMANLQNAKTMSSGTATFAEFYASLVGTVGVHSQEAINSHANFELVLQQVELARESVQGVSLDEEMTNLIRYQHAYDAAARVITTMDEAMETIIHGMGA